MPEYMTKSEPVDKKPYIVYTDEKGILYSGDPDSDIPGGGDVNIGEVTKLPYMIYFKPEIGLIYDPSNADIMVASGISIGEKTIIPWEDMLNIEQTAIGITATVTPPMEQDYRGAYIVTVDLTDRNGTISAVEPVDMPITHSTATKDGLPIHLYSWVVIENPDESVPDVSAKMLVLYANEN